MSNGRAPRPLCSGGRIPPIPLFWNDELNRGWLPGRFTIFMTRVWAGSSSTPQGLPGASLHVGEIPGFVALRRGGGPQLNMRVVLYDEAMYLLRPPTDGGAGRSAYAPLPAGWKLRRSRPAGRHPWRRPGGEQVSDAELSTADGVYPLRAAVLLLP